MSERVRIRLILAKRPEESYPTIIGCMDETVWEHCDEEYEDKWRAESKERFGAPERYEFREVWAHLSLDALGEVFTTPDLSATILPLDG